MILAGDIGGTKTLLAWYSLQGECITMQQFASAEFEQFTDLLQCFLQQTTPSSIDFLCLGVAGPIVNGDCHATNLPWNLSCQTIKQQTGAKKVVLLNDLQATAWGVLNLPEQDFTELNPKAEFTSLSNIAVLAAGTGLGEAIIVYHEQLKDYIVLSTEGGHTDFAPVDSLQTDLLEYLQHKYQGHVSYERIVSGMGIVNIYDFLKHSGFADSQKSTEDLFNSQDKASVISAHADKGSDPLSVKTMQIFCQCYGQEAGNLALKTLSYGGVILAGGIASKNLSLMQDGLFFQSFVDKGRYRPLLEKISVKICLNPEAALFGAACYALQRI